MGRDAAPLGGPARGPARPRRESAALVDRAGRPDGTGLAGRISDTDREAARPRGPAEIAPRAAAP